MNHTPAFTNFETLRKEQRDSLTLLVGVVKRRVKNIRRRLEKSNGRRVRKTTINKYASVLQFTFEWDIVATVMLAETYLQDVLAFLAKFDPSVMEKSDAVATYAEVMAAKTTEDLADELRSRWARNFLDRGGPKLWIERLQRMGARGYREGLGEQLELWWGVRHLVVHNAGVVNREFIRRHPECSAQPGNRLDVNVRQAKAFRESVDHLVLCTETFVLARTRSWAPL